MGVLSGPMTARRFRVIGDLPDGWRDLFRDKLGEFAFREPPGGVGKEEVEGWVSSHNLLDTDFSDFNRWLYNNYAVFSLRVDKKSLPTALFKATLQKQCDAWCLKEGRERCPNAVKNELKERLEEEWLVRAFPRVALTEILWKVDGGYVLVGASSEKTLDRVRKRFLQSFGLRLVPFSPLDWADSRTRDDLLATSPTLGGTP